MNALAHYCTLLSTMAASDEGEKLRLEARGLYERLEVVDADRKERYRDMGELSMPRSTGLKLTVQLNEHYHNRCIEYVSHLYSIIYTWNLPIPPL